MGIVHIPIVKAVVHGDLLLLSTSEVCLELE